MISSRHHRLCLFSHLSLPFPRVGWWVLQRPFNFTLLVAHSSLIFHSFISLLHMSSRHNRGLPLACFPSILISTSALIFFIYNLLFYLPKPFHTSHYHYDLLQFCFLQDLIISPMFQSAHTHCPSHHPHL